MTQHQNATPRFDPKGYCHTHGYKGTVGHYSKTCRTKKPGHQDDTTRQNTMGGTKRKEADYKIINSIYFTPGCTNPPNLTTTALLDTAANISLLTPHAPAQRNMTTLPTKTIMQPSGDTLTTTGNVTLLLPKLPQAAKEAYHISGLTNNLLSASALVDACCELFFHQGAR
ncbi:hypothetical protein ACHAW6_004114 [Cyclotella cf. meneghiniana]